MSRSIGRGTATSLFRQWLALNENELKWVALAGGVCVAVGLALA
jgi:hypothetical protein